MGLFYSKPRLRRVNRELDTKRKIRKAAQKIKTLSPKERKVVGETLGKERKYGITRQELRRTLKDLRKQKEISLVDKRNIEKEILGRKDRMADKEMPRNRKSIKTHPHV